MKLSNKLILILFLIFSGTNHAQLYEFGEARGLFLSIGTGPKIPIGTFSDSHNLGIGFNVALSYTDNEFLPVFLYSKIGFQHFPGKQAYYKRTDYSAISSNVVHLQPGIRLYLPPLFNEDFILMPVIEGGLTWAFFMENHQFKIGSGRTNFDTDKNKFGFHLGGGFSMFLMDVMANYNFVLHHQYLSFDLRVRIPIFVKV
jgi:hypothetical protein